MVLQFARLPNPFQMDHWNIFPRACDHAGTRPKRMLSMPIASAFNVNTSALPVGRLLFRLSMTSQCLPREELGDLLGEFHHALDVTALVVVPAQHLNLSSIDN